MTIPSPLCLWRRVWYSLRHAAHVSGCMWERVEYHEAQSRDLAVEIIRCSECGRRDVLWATEPIPGFEDAEEARVTCPRGGEC